MDTGRQQDARTVIRTVYGYSEDFGVGVDVHHCAGTSLNVVVVEANSRGSISLVYIEEVYFGVIISYDMMVIVDSEEEVIRKSFGGRVWKRKR